MKTILFILMIITIASCQRATDLLNRVPLPPGVDSSKYQFSDTNCQVIGQSSPYIDKVPESQAFGFQKSINVNTGKVESLVTAIGYPLEVDSGLFSFEYLSDSVVHMTGVIKTYNRFNSAQEWEMDVATMIDAEIRLDENNHVTSVGGPSGDQFIYENGLLKAVQRPSNPAPYDVVSFSYDTLGNLVQVRQGDQDNNFTIKYEYDYSKTATAQMYSPIPIFELNVMEIMGWLPIPSKHLRNRHIVSLRTTDMNGMVNETLQREILYSNHVINETGALQAFDAHIEGIDLDATIINTVDCTIKTGWRMPR